MGHICPSASVVQSGTNWASWSRRPEPKCQLCDLSQPQFPYLKDGTNDTLITGNPLLLCRLLISDRNFVGLERRTTATAMESSLLQAGRSPSSQDPQGSLMSQIPSPSPF